MKKIKISTDFIKLGQLLKLASITDSGAHSKMIIVNGEVKLNGEVEKQRGKKVFKGDVVEVEGFKLYVE